MPLLVFVLTISYFLSLSLLSLSLLSLSLLAPLSDILLSLSLFSFSLPSCLSLSECETVVEQSVWEILESVSTGGSNQDCISQLASLSGVKLSSPNTLIHDSVSSYSLDYNRIAA